MAGYASSIEFTFDSTQDLALSIASMNEATRTGTIRSKLSVFTAKTGEANQVAVWNPDYSHNRRKSGALMMTPGASQLILHFEVEICAFLRLQQFCSHIHAL